MQFIFCFLKFFFHLSLSFLPISLCRFQMPQTYVAHLGNSKELMEVAKDNVARRVLREHIRESLGVRNDDLLFAIINSKHLYSWEGRPISYILLCRWGCPLSSVHVDHASYWLYGVNAIFCILNLSKKYAAIRSYWQPKYFWICKLLVARDLITFMQGYYLSIDKFPENLRTSLTSGRSLSCLDTMTFPYALDQCGMSFIPNNGMLYNLDWGIFFTKKLQK